MSKPARNTNSMMQRRSLRVTEQLLGELEAKRFDSALVKRILAAPSASPHLLRACYLAQERRFASARADVEHALRNAELSNTRSPVAELVAGMILFTTRDYGRAFELFERAAELSPSAAVRARAQIVGLASQLGWDQEVRRALEAQIAVAPEEPSWHAQAVKLFVRGRDWEQALTHAERALELTPDSAGLWMEAAGLHARLNQREAARAGLGKALERMSPEQEVGYRIEAARVAIDASAFDLAQAQFERALLLEPHAPRHHLGLAQLASWRADTTEAWAQTELALVLDPNCAGALRMRGALEFRRGEIEAARASLNAALAADRSDYQAHVWLAELELREGQHERAHAHLGQAVAQADDFLFVAALLRFLLVAAEPATAEDDVPASQIEEFEAALRELCPARAAKALESRQLEDTVAAVEAALEALGANRSTQATHHVDGELTRVSTRTGCRHACRRALQLLRVAEPARSFAALDTLVAEYPESSLPWSHRGELQLWLGDYDAGKADLDRAIALIRGTRWAYIGLSTLGLLNGDYVGSLAVNARGVRAMKGTEGPAIHIYRGEAKRLLGKMDEAIVELEAAHAHHPSRASATINLALAYYNVGRIDEANALWSRLREEQAAGLLSDAARELEIAIWLDEDGEDDRPQVPIADRVRVLEQGLAMMGGNRSSGLLSYWTRSKQLRFCPLWPLQGDAPHARDHAYLDQAKRLMLKALARYSGPRRASS